MRRRLLGAGEQQAVAVRALVLDKVLQHALGNFLIVGIIAELCRRQSEPLHQRPARRGVCQVGLGPAYACLGIERANRRLDAVE